MFCFVGTGTGASFGFGSGSFFSCAPICVDNITEIMTIARVVGRNRVIVSSGGSAYVTEK